MKMDEMKLLTFTSLEGLAKSRESILEMVKKSSYCCIRGLIDSDAVKASLLMVKNRLADEQLEIGPSRCSPSFTEKNSVKWSIGGYSNTQSGIARCMVTLMNPMNEENIYQMRDSYLKLIAVRDILGGRNEIMLDELLPDGLYNGTRIQYYPSGGGFMTTHTDSVGVSNMNILEGQYIQVILVLSQRGVDYVEGGAYVLDDKGDIINIEEYSQQGDIIVYDGRTRHGVMDIDPSKVLDLKKGAGRYVALATVYRRI